MIVRTNQKAADFNSAVANIRYNVINAVYQNKFSFAGVFCQILDNETTANICFLDGNFTVCTSDNADFQEITSFLKMQGAVTIFAEKNTAQKLGMTIKSTFSALILKRDKLPNNMQKTAGDKEHFRDAYNILAADKSGNISMPDFNSWYSDFCIRYNHGYAQYTVENGCAAIAGFVFEDSALITGIAVPTEKQGQGFGTSILESLETKLYNAKEIYVCTNENTSVFYEKNGFSKYGEYCIGDYNE